MGCEGGRIACSLGIDCQSLLAIPKWRTHACVYYSGGTLATLLILVLQRYQWVILNAECVSPSESEQQSQGLLNRIVFCVGFDRPFIHRAIRCARG
jgi:hypothetical protein